MQYQIVDTKEKLEQLLNTIANEPVLALDTETVGLNWLKYSRMARNLKLSALVKPFKYKRLYNKYMTKVDNDESGLRFFQNRLGMLQIASEDIIYLIRPKVFTTSTSVALESLLNNCLVLIIHNTQFDWKILKQHLGIELNCKNVHDTFIAERLITNGTGLACGLKDVLARRFGVALDKTKRVSNWLGPWNKGLIDYACKDVEHLFQLKTAQRAELSQLGLRQTYELERQVLPINAQMEMEGVGVDLAYIKTIKKDLTEEVEVLRTNCVSLLGVSNPNSPKESLLSLQQAGLKVKDTNAKTLKAYESNPLVKALLDYREKNTLLTRYFASFGEIAVKQGDGSYRIYAEFNQNGTDTGRWSSSNPNLQNIPKEAKYRRLVIPRPGYVFVQADTAQIELRLLADLAEDESLLQAFEDGRDVHKLAASLVYGIAEHQVTKDQRGYCKAVGFGILYGQTEFGLAPALGISEASAKDLIARYMRHFYQVNKWLEATKAQSTKQGFSETVLGRKRFYPDVASKDIWKVKAALRQAANMVIQGTAADGLKASIVILAEKLKSYDARLIGCFHDEVLIECKRGVEQEITILVKQSIIEGYTKYIKRVKIEVGSEDNGFEPLIISHWGEAK